MIACLRENSQCGQYGKEEGYQQNEQSDAEAARQEEAVIPELLYPGTHI